MGGLGSSAVVLSRTFQIRHAVLHLLLVLADRRVGEIPKITVASRATLIDRQIKNEDGTTAAVHGAAEAYLAEFREKVGKGELTYEDGWVEVTKYRVEPGFYNATLHTLVNLKKWKSLTKPQQDLFTAIGREFEGRSEITGPGFQALLKKQKELTASKGMKTITFEGADREKWEAAARKEGWAEVLKRSPVHGPKLMKLFTK